MGLIGVEHVSKSYNGKVGAGVPVLFDINIEIAERQFVALMGPSGSGKSTLLTIVGGMNRPSSGKLWIDGIEFKPCVG